MPDDVGKPKTIARWMLIAGLVIAASAVILFWIVEIFYL